MVCEALVVDTKRERVCERVTDIEGARTMAQRCLSLPVHTGMDAGRAERVLEILDASLSVLKQEQHEPDAAGTR